MSIDEIGNNNQTGDVAGRDIHRTEGGIAIEASDGGSIIVQAPIAGPDQHITYGLTTEEVVSLFVELKRVDQPTVWDGRVPYKGLAAFEEKDAPFFFGRESLVDNLLKRVAEANFIAIAGPSGSGKSSVAQAGLFHTLKEGRLPESDAWLLATMTSGSDPVEGLAETIEEMAMKLNTDSGSELRWDHMGDFCGFSRNLCERSR
jgi:hypothetical protein